MRNPKVLIEDTFEPIRKKRLHGAHLHKAQRRLLPRCNGKHSYHTERDCADVRRKLLTSGQAIFLRVYRCMTCCHWHLTSKQLKKNK